MSGVAILRISAPLMMIKAYKGVFLSCLGLTITHATATSAPQNALFFLHALEFPGCTIG